MDAVLTLCSMSCSKVGELLGVSPGGSVIFAVDGNKVSLRRAEELDAAFLRPADASFSDWAVPEADEAFRNR